jgi:hypothetical protein
MKNYGKLVAVLLVGWFILAFSASALHILQNGANRIGVGVGVAALVPLVLFSLWFAFSKSFRQFSLSLNPTVLTSLQAARLIGFSFVLLEARGVLPAIFALPGGYGDMTIGATAAFVAWKFVTPRHRNSFVLWQLLGITDLVLAVSLGTTAFLLSPQGPSTAPMTVLPLSLIPTFLVPFFLICHVICIAQARTWSAASQPNPQALTPARHPAI